jgi:hypothetical protein
MKFRFLDNIYYVIFSNSYLRFLAIFENETVQAIALSLFVSFFENSN